MPASKTCAKCGTTLTAESVLDVCPRCVAPQILFPTGFTGSRQPEEAEENKDDPPHPYVGGYIEQPGDRIGRYKLLEKLGEGGCGVVYVAEQEEPVRRRVALKVIKLGLETKSVIARFEAERQGLALMDHPNIAKVFDAGVTGQRSEVGDQKSEIRGQRSEVAAGAGPTSD